MRSRKVLAIGVLLIGVVTAIGLAYLASDTGVVAQGIIESAHVLSPATEVGGIINTSTTWTKANSPYILTSDVQIAPEVTLTIESGVVVSPGDPGASLSIVTFGTLLVNGTADNQVVFHGINFMQGSHTTGTPPFLIDIHYAQIYYGSIGNVSIGSTIGSLRVQDSYLQYQMVVWGEVTAQLERNIFDGAGIYLSTRGQVYIRNNVFVNQNGGYAIQDERASTAIVERNSFLSKDQIVVRIGNGSSNTELDARNNFWNTNDPKVIASMIYDRNDDLNVSSTVPFEPFLTAPDPDTPSYDPPTPTPTPTDTPTETPTPTSTLTPDLIATQTAISNQIETAVAATLTALAPKPTVGTGTPQPNQLSLPSIILQMPAIIAPVPTPNLPFTLGTSESCTSNTGNIFFSGFVRDNANNQMHGVCVHISVNGPRATKCSGCDGMDVGTWDFSPFDGPTSAGTPVEIFVVPCSGAMPPGGQTEKTGFGDLTPQSPKWLHTMNGSEQCTGITFYKK